MEKVLEHGNVRVVVEMPEMPEGVELRVELEFHAKAEESSRAAIEALGGVLAFESFMRHFSTGQTQVTSMKGAGYAKPLHVSLWTPTGRDRPVPESPFLRELHDEQTAAAALATVAP